MSVTAGTPKAYLPCFIYDQKCTADQFFFEIKAVSCRFGTEYFQFDLEQAEFTEQFDLLYI